MSLPRERICSYARSQLISSWRTLTVSAHLPSSCTTSQLGSFRLGLFDANHFVISHNVHYMCVVASISNGVWWANLKDRPDLGWANLKDRPLATELLSPEKHGIIFGDRYIEFRPTALGGGDTWFRISAFSEATPQPSAHLSFHSSSGKTSALFDQSGNLHKGPSDWFRTGPGTTDYRAATPNEISSGVGIPSLCHTKKTCCYKLSCHTYRHFRPHELATTSSYVRQNVLTYIHTFRHT